jgi:hypothetical protein
MAATIVYFILGPGWMNRLNTEATEGTRKTIVLVPKAMAKADDGAKKEKAIGSSHRVDKSVRPIPKAVVKTDDKAKTENVIGSPTETAKEIVPAPIEAPKAKGVETARNPTPAPQPMEEMRQQRLKEVRQLLKEAEIAREKGKYLDAVLGFGQAAVLYPQELAEVESPEQVRLQFLDALKGYQAEVERALQKAAKQKAGGQQAGPKISDPKSR